MLWSAVHVWCFTLGPVDFISMGSWKMLSFKRPFSRHLAIWGLKGSKVRGVWFLWKLAAASPGLYEKKMYSVIKCFSNNLLQFLWPLNPAVNTKKLTLSILCMCFLMLDHIEGYVIYGLKVKMLFVTINSSATAQLVKWLDYGIDNWSFDSHKWQGFFSLSPYSYWLQDPPCL